MNAFLVLISHARRCRYYFYKVILLMWLIVGLTCSAFLFPPTHLEQRMNIAATMFLATAATLYVTSADLPKTSKLTKLDILVVGTLFIQFMVAVESCTLYSIHEDVGTEKALIVDRLCALTGSLIYLALNIWLFFWEVAKDISADMNLRSDVVREERRFVPWEDVPQNDPWGAGEDSRILTPEADQSSDTTVI